MKAREEIEKWLQERIAAEIKVAPEAVSVNVPFANYGLESIVFVTLVSDLEDWLELSLDPTIFWEYPTIKLLSEWIVREDFSDR